MSLEIKNLIFLVGRNHSLDVASRLTDHFEPGLLHTREMTTAAGPGHLPALLITPIFHQTSSLPLCFFFLKPALL